MGTAAADRKRTAVVIIHGIGQQHPFEALGTFASGIRAALIARGMNVSQTHTMERGTDGIRHGIRIDERDGTVGFDVFEVYWASLCQRKATLRGMARWILATGFTPVQRLSFNLPLIWSRAASAANRSATESAKRRQKSAEEAARARPGALRKAWFYARELLAELLRASSLSLFAIVLAGGLLTLAGNATEYLNELKTLLGNASALVSGFSAALTALLTAGIGLGTLTLVLSIVSQIRDLIRLEKIEPVLERDATQRYHRPRASKVIASLAKGAVEAEVDQEKRALRVYREGRRRFLLLSLVASIVGLAALFWIILMPLSLGGVFPSPAVRSFITAVATTRFPLLALLLLAAAYSARIAVDYLGDVAVYTSADENSAFFETRNAILKHSTAELRRILKDPQYDQVVLAGHSLGSVIAYDTLNKVIVEARVAPKTGTEPSLTQQADLLKLRTLVTFGSPLNKVLYFFRVQVKANETLRAHIVQELHAFASWGSTMTRGEHVDDNTQPPKTNIAWFNYWSAMDPVSARLDYYRRVEERKRPYRIFGLAHLSYWHDQELYAELVKECIAPVRAEWSPALMPVRVLKPKESSAVS